MEKKTGIGKRLLSMLLAAAVMVTAQGMPAAAETGYTGAYNPSYDAGSDDTTWHYITFGSYPQTEVDGEELTEEITQATYDGAGDAWVDGVKYRRLSKTNTDNSDYFGTEAYRYFKWEKIDWRIINEDEDGILTVMADQGLDCKKYNEGSNSASWGNASIREWLNQTFYNTAFNSSEQGNIQENAGDKVCLLTDEQAVNTEYGFSDDSAQNSLSRRRKASAYANARGAFVDAQSGYEGNCWWWMRPQSEYSSDAKRVTKEGVIEAWDLTKTYGAVIPVLKIKQDTTSTLNPSYNSGTDKTEWNYVSFGSYPQAEIDAENDRALYVQLENATYVDGEVEIDGTKYSRIQKGDAGTANFGDAEYRYFKWEPIRWKILRQNDSTLFLMADKALDARQYDDMSASVWQDSALRTWLNDAFYQKAFTQYERNAIASQWVQNEANPSYATDGGDETLDNVYLLSIQEAETSVNGFRGDGSATSSRQIPASSYAYRMGAYVNESGNSRCWLRSPGNSSSYTANIDVEGRVDRSGQDKSYFNAVVPVLHVSKGSSAWSLVENEGQSLQVSPQGGSYWPIQENDSLTLNVKATDGHPFGYTYQWYCAPTAEGKGTRIDGATSSSYTIENASTANTGYYYCVVTSGKYQVTSGWANVIVSPSSAGNPGTPDNPANKPPALTGITLSPANLSLKVGAKGELTAALTPASANAAVKWASSNEKVAKAEPNGGTKATITAVAAGTATITAEAGGKTAKCTVTVTANTNTNTNTKPATPSKPPSGSTTKPAAKLPAPKLTVKLTSSNAVKLTWKKVSGATGYYVYRTDSKKGKFKKIATTKKTSYKNSKLKSNKTYYYKVAAYKGKKTGTYSKVVSKKILGKPSTPKMKFTNKSSAQKFTISWNKLKHASHVEIWRKINKKGTYKKWKTVSAKKGKATYSYRSYTRGRTYFFQIRSYYVKDKVKVYSGYSKGLGIQL